MTETVSRLVREMMHISDNVFYISFALLLLVIVLFVVYWFYTRKKMQELQHQIPATVLKNYLDSVIQNSNALKSSLFRGGGLEAGEGINSSYHKAWPTHLELALLDSFYQYFPKPDI